MIEYQLILSYVVEEKPLIIHCLIVREGKPLSSCAEQLVQLCLNVESVKILPLPDKVLVSLLPNAALDIHNCLNNSSGCQLLSSW